MATLKDKVNLASDNIITSQDQLSNISANGRTMRPYYCLNIMNWQT